nr:redoxin domain-containing protein [Variovorax sp. WS11]
MILFTLLTGVTAVALGVDTVLLARLSSGSGGASVEKSLFQRPRPPPMENAPAAPLRAAAPVRSGFMTVQANAAGARLPTLPIEGAMPPLTGAVEWLSSPPLTAEALRGKVVLVDFWTYSCINCLNALPHVRDWHRKYKDQHLVVVGVHSPEFAFEKSINNVKRAVHRLEVAFPVAIDNNYTIWRAFGNNCWPAHYFVDAKGRIRFHHLGEGEYEESEQVIQQLLEEARKEARPI